jgi:hypothetical protein
MLALTLGKDYASRMRTVTLSAHVEGETIHLDEPFVLPPDAKLLVTILPDAATNGEREEWYSRSKAALSRAYSDDEPGYPIDLIRRRSAFLLKANG